MSLPFRFSGDYASWAEAERLTTGDQPEFRDKAMRAALAVAQGHAAHARDGALSDHIVYSWPLLAGLMFVAARSGGRLRVLDFGGGPAITYLQNRRFLRHVPHLDWRIVEKPDYCDFARANLSLPQVSFHTSIDSAILPTLPDAAIFSAVLTIVEHPYELLRDVAARAIPHILIDRTWMSQEGRDRLTVFRANANAHPNMSRPYWFLDEARLRSTLEPAYELIEKFEVPSQPVPFPAEQVGYIFARR